MHVFLLCAHVHYRRPWSLDMSTSCPLSLSLPNQKHFLLLLSVCSSSSSSRPRFFLLFSSGQGCTSNYKSIEAWPGLCNLCGIFVQRRFCVRAASENGPGSAFWSGIGLFLSALFPTNPNHFFFSFFFLRGTWLNKNVPYARQDSRTWPKQIINSSSRFSANISLRPRSLACMFRFLNVSAECWIASSPISAVLSSLSLGKHRCFFFLPPLYPQCTALFPCADS